MYCKVGLDCHCPHIYVISCIHVGVNEPNRDYYSKTSYDEPWLLAWDLNNILSTSKTLGGICTTNCHMIRFQKFLNEGDLCSLNATGVPFIWANNHRDSIYIYERLDRVVANPHWFNTFPNAYQENLSIVGSDHGPIRISITSLVIILLPLNLKLYGQDIQAVLMLFNMLGIINHRVYGSPTHKFNTLCNICKCLARSWNKNVFRDILNKIKEDQ